MDEPMPHAPAADEPDPQPDPPASPALRDAAAGFDASDAESGASDDDGRSDAAESGASDDDDDGAESDGSDAPEDDRPELDPVEQARQLLAAAGARVPGPPEDAVALLQLMEQWATHHDIGEARGAAFKNLMEARGEAVDMNVDPNIIVAAAVAAVAAARPPHRGRRVQNDPGAPALTAAQVLATVTLVSDIAQRVRLDPDARLPLGNCNPTGTGKTRVALATAKVALELALVVRALFYFPDCIESTLRADATAVRLPADQVLFITSRDVASLTADDVERARFVFVSYAAHSTLQAAVRARTGPFDERVRRGRLGAAYTIKELHNNRVFGDPCGNVVLFIDEQPQQYCVYDIFPYQRDGGHLPPRAVTIAIDALPNFSSRRMRGVMSTMFTGTAAHADSLVAVARWRDPATLVRTVARAPMPAATAPVVVPILGASVGDFDAGVASYPLAIRADAVARLLAAARRAADPRAAGVNLVTTARRAGLADNDCELVVDDVQLAAGVFDGDVEPEMRQKALKAAATAQAIVSAGGPHRSYHFYTHHRAVAKAVFNTVTSVAVRDDWAAHLFRLGVGGMSDAARGSVVPSVRDAARRGIHYTFVGNAPAFGRGADLTAVDLVALLEVGHLWQAATLGHVLGRARPAAADGPVPLLLWRARPEDRSTLGKAARKLNEVADVLRAGQGVPPAVAAAVANAQAREE